MGHDTVQTKHIKQQVELLQNENNRLRMESESLLKVIELLSVQQINTHKAKYNTENFVTVKGNGEKIKLNDQHDSRIPLRNSLEILQLKNTRTNRNLMMRKSQCHHHLIIHLVKEDLKSSQLNTANNQRLTLLTTNMKNPLYRGKQV